MKTTLKRLKRNRRTSIKYTITNFLIMSLFLQFSINSICNITEYISKNIQYYELSKYIQDMTLIDDNSNLNYL